jgi:hypothetical protein
MFIHNDADMKNIEIADNIKDTIAYIMLDRKYNIMYLTGNTIVYQRWAGLKYKAKGIAYTSDGRPPEIEYMVYHEQLKDKNWFYFEENYATWRLEHSPDERAYSRPCKWE